MKSRSLSFSLQLVLGSFFLLLPSVASAKKASVQMAVEGGVGGTVHVTSLRQGYSCATAVGCDGPDIVPGVRIVAEAIPKSGYEVAGWRITDLDGKFLDKFGPEKKIKRLQHKNGTRIIVFFKNSVVAEAVQSPGNNASQPTASSKASQPTASSKASQPTAGKAPQSAIRGNVTVLVDGGVGGSIIVDGKHTCTQKKACTFPVGNSAIFSAKPGDGSDAADGHKGFEVESWTVTDAQGQVEVFANLTSLGLKHTDNVRQVSVKFREKLYLPIVSVVDGVGGTITDGSGKTCATAAPCVFAPRKMFDKISWHVVPATGYTYTYPSRFTGLGFYMNRSDNSVVKYPITFTNTPPFDSSVPADASDIINSGLSSYGGKDPTSSWYGNKYFLKFVMTINAKVAATDAILAKAPKLNLADFDVNSRAPVMISGLGSSRTVKKPVVFGNQLYFFTSPDDHKFILNRVALDGSTRLTPMDLPAGYLPGSMMPVGDSLQMILGPEYTYHSKHGENSIFDATIDKQKPFITSLFSVDMNGSALPSVELANFMFDATLAAIRTSEVNYTQDSVMTIMEHVLGVGWGFLKSFDFTAFDSRHNVLGRTTYTPMLPQKPEVLDSWEMSSFARSDSYDLLYTSSVCLGDCLKGWLGKKLVLQLGTVRKDMSQLTWTKQVSIPDYDAGNGSFIAMGDGIWSNDKYWFIPDLFSGQLDLQKDGKWVMQQVDKATGVVTPIVSPRSLGLFLDLHVKNVIGDRIYFVSSPSSSLIVVDATSGKTISLTSVLPDTYKLNESDFYILSTQANAISVIIDSAQGGVFLVKMDRDGNPLSKPVQLAPPTGKRQNPKCTWANNSHICVISDETTASLLTYP